MQISVLKPAEAPPGIQRLLPFLRESLAEAEYQACRIIVAFARLSGVVRLLPQIRAWRERGHPIEAIVGIDRLGTSREALHVMLDELDAVYITRTADESCTFHPKMYLFEGEHRARAVVGSHNLTLGGLETNFEGGVIVDLQLPKESAQWKPFRDAWDQLLPDANPSTRRLDTVLLAELIDAGHLLPEHRLAKAARAGAPRDLGPAVRRPDPFPLIPPAPPSPLPRDVISEVRLARTSERKRAMPAVVERPSTRDEMLHALVIEIVPRANADVELSKQAVKASPGFFRFRGKVTPKKAKNQPYPARYPTVLVRIYGPSGGVVFEKRLKPEMYDYKRKAGVRINLTKPVTSQIPPYSVMVMWGGSSRLPTGLDYVIDVFVPGSPGQKKWESAMNVTLPSGGKAQPRRMGWI